jgi:hypothetical protein
MIGESEGASTGGGDTEAVVGIVGIAIWEFDVGIWAEGGTGVVEWGAGAGVDLADGAEEDWLAMKLTRLLR